MDIDYSPTGREFVTGSYDRTVSYFCIRISDESILVTHTLRYWVFAGEDFPVQWWT